MAYNGWKNKETWLVNLWLGDVLTEDQESGTEITADYVEQFVDDMVDQAMNAGKWSNCVYTGHNGFVTDLLNCALCEIDYHELAAHYVEELEDA
jgi:hypothetical protein